MTDFGDPMSPRQRQALLQAEFPAWEIWYVPLALGGMTWCARRYGDLLRNVIHADTAAHLAEYVQEAQAETDAPQRP